jgi:hypothetical protein
MVKLKTRRKSYGMSAALCALMAIVGCARRALANDGQKDYEPYAYKRGIFRNYRQLMEKHWQPYLDGKSDFAQAIKQMVAGL